MPTRARWQLVVNAWDVQERLGSPEGELALAQAIVYLACAPKSNAVYMASIRRAAMRPNSARWTCRCICATRRPS